MSRLHLIYTFFALGLQKNFSGAVIVPHPSGIAITMPRGFEASDDQTQDSGSPFRRQLSSRIIWMLISDSLLNPFFLFSEVLKSKRSSATNSYPLNPLKELFSRLVFAFSSIPIS